MWHVILNTVSGQGQAAANWQALQPTLEAHGYQFTQVAVPNPDQLANQVKSLVEEGVRNLLVLGGDGTQHHVINGLMNQNACPTTEVKYAFWPQGSGNDWARTHRIPASPTAWRKLFLRQSYKLQNLGLIEARGFEGEPLRRYFCNVAGMGYDAFVVDYLKRQGISQSGSIKYFLSIYSCLRDYSSEPLRVSTDTESWESSFYTLNIGVCKYSGGGMSFVPQADPRGDHLGLTMVGDIPSWRVAINTPWLYTPFFDRHPITIGRKAQSISVEHQGERPISIEAEGELVGQTPARFTLIKDAFRFLG